MEGRRPSPLTSFPSAQSKRAELLFSFLKDPNLLYDLVSLSFFDSRLLPLDLDGLGRFVAFSYFPRGRPTDEVAFFPTPQTVGAVCRRGLFQGVCLTSIFAMPGSCRGTFSPARGDCSSFLLSETFVTKGLPLGGLSFIFPSFSLSFGYRRLNWLSAL